MATKYGSVRKRHHIFDRRTARARVRQLISSGADIFYATTGAGLGVGKLVWEVAGISPAFAGQYVPYDEMLFDEFVERKWQETGEPRCGLQSALALAQSAYFTAQRACVKKGRLGVRPVGVGLTAAAATNRTLRGGTRCFAAVRTDAGIWSVEVRMEQGKLGRIGDGNVCDLIALNLGLFGAGIEGVPFASGELGLTSANFEGFSLSPHPVPCPDLKLDGFVDVYIDELGIATPLLNLPSNHFEGKVVFPGSFNLMHFAHDAAANKVREETGRQVIFEMTADHAHKSSSLAEVAARAWQFRGRWPVIVRRGVSRFVDKCHAYPCAWFLCGMDVAEKVLDPKYYPESGGLLGALESLRLQDVGFYVMDRREPDGRLKTKADLAIPDGYSALFNQVSTHWDVRSSDLRTARGTK